MEANVTCPKCKETDLYEKSERINVGTFAVTIWAVRCHNCDNTIKLYDDESDFPKNKDLILDIDKDTGGIVISKESKEFKINKKGDAFERAHNGDIKEYWVQKFFKEHFRDYGFTSLQGPFDVGPDFTTKGGIGIEVERIWKFYIVHGHGSNESFSKVKYLILLSPEKPPLDKLKLLPDNILYINIEKFVPWFRRECKEFIEEKTNNSKELQLTLRIKLIEGEFYRRYLQICPDKDRDMAICPSCQGCAYEPEYDFSRWAIEFIISYDFLIWNEDISFGEIRPEYLDEFFNEMLDI